LLGQPIKSGYQSHFVVTNKEGGPITKLNKFSEFNELVVAQEAQAVPIYLVYVTFGDFCTEILFRRVSDTEVDKKSMNEHWKRRRHRRDSAGEKTEAA
jgi:hypothetical protein